LESFETANNLFGSPKSAERFLNIVTVICIILYFGIAIQLNLASK
jgi:preprotein translocase subunit SecG